MTPDPVDRSRSRAILIGVSTYMDSSFPSIRAALNSLEGFRQLLVDPRQGRWPDGRITILENPTNGGKVAKDLRELTRGVRDALLVYYVGHGKLTPRGDLCLTVQDTSVDAAEFTSLHYDWLKQALNESPAQTKVVILDCCFSGRAVEALADSDVVADVTAVKGTYTLTATEGTQTAHVVPPAEQVSEPTSFTGELLTLVKHGIPGGPPDLTFSDIYPYLQQRLAERGLPRPNQRGTNTADRFVLAANTAATSPPTIHEGSSLPSASMKMTPRSVPATSIQAPRSETPPAIAAQSGQMRRSAADKTKLSVAAAGLTVALAIGAVAYNATRQPDEESANAGVTTDLRPPEEIVVGVLNSGRYADTASDLTDELSRIGYRTELPAKAPEQREATTVLYAESFGQEAAALAERIGAAGDRVVPLEASPWAKLTEADLLVLVADDLST